MPAIEELEEVGYIARLPREERFPRQGKNRCRVVFSKPGAVPPRLSPPAANGTPRPAPEADSEIPPIVARLVEKGVTPEVAMELASSRAEDEIDIQIQVLEWFERTGQARKNPGAWLAKAIRQGYTRPPMFEQSKRRPDPEKTRREQEERARSERRKSHDEAINARVASYWAGLSPEGQEALKAEAIAATDEETRELIESGPHAKLREQVRREVIKDYIVNMLKLDECDGG
jgi:hypothetical protein